MNCRNSLLLYIVAAVLLSVVSCRQQQAPIVAVEYKRDFPVDTAIILQEIPMEMPTVPALPCRLGNRLVVVGSYQTAYLYTYPDLRLVRSCQLPPFASHSVMGDELYLESQGKVDVYRLDHSDSLVLARSFRTVDVPYSVGKVQPFDINEYVRYDDKFLAGFMANHYDVQPLDAWKNAEQRIRNDFQTRIMNRYGASHVDFLDIKLSHVSKSFKYLMLPLYISAVKYKNKVYNQYTNGQTGKVAGKAPLSWLKIGLVSLLGIAAIVALYLLLM